MNRFSSRRPLAFLLAALTVLGLAASAQSAPRRFASRGTAQFVSANDFVGAGNATHLGKYSEQGSVEFSPTGDPTILQLDASSTYTAANGDKLYAVFVGFLDTLTGRITATVTYEGGTGRFVHASGTATFSGWSYPDGSIDAAVQGTIDY